MASLTPLFIALQLIKLVYASSNYFMLPLHQISGAYFAKLDIGTPPTEFRVAVDTGSSDLWIHSQNDPACSLNIAGFSNCTFGVFNSSNSSTYTNLNQSFTALYQDTTFANGVYSTDDIGANGLPLGTFQFALVNDSSTPMGILGVSLPQLEASALNKGRHQYKNFPLQLYENGIISYPAYSVYLNGNKGSNVLFGGIDHHKYKGQLVKMPLIKGIQPEIKTLSVELNSLSITVGDSLSISPNSSTFLFQGSIPAIIDTGTTIATLPLSLYKQLALALGLQYDAVYDGYIGSCSSLEEKNIHFSFSGVLLSAPALNFVANLTENTCIYVASPSIVPQLVLGQAFLENVYLVVDLQAKSLAMAQSNLHSDISDIQVLENGILSIPIVSDLVSIRNTSSIPTPQHTSTSTTKPSTHLQTLVHKHSVANGATNIFSIGSHWWLVAYIALY